MIITLNLQQFAEEGAAAAPEAGTAETAAAESAQPAEAQGAEPAINAGDVLPDGQKVQNARVAAALKKQMERHPELKKVYGQTPKQQPAEVPDAEPTIEQRWEQAKRGEFAEQYGRDVQNAVRERFKNQKDQQEFVDKVNPMLKVFMDRAGVDNVDDLIKQVMDDDSLYEEAANEHGMTVSAYKEFMAAKQKLEQFQQQDAQRQEQTRIRQHLDNLRQQEAEMKKLYPDFSLENELKNREFLKLTGPDIGMSVEDAYFAVHHRELAPQMMAYGMQRARTQMGQTLQAQRQRPAEGAMKAGGSPAAEVKLDPRNLTRAERAEIKRQVRLGKRVSFD